MSTLSEEERQEMKSKLWEVVTNYMFPIETQVKAMHVLALMDMREDEQLPRNNREEGK